jgi:hypothetical protein
MKKIISFSIWGKDDKYINGALRNVKLARQFYPNWVPRFYYQSDMSAVSEDFIQSLKNIGSEVIPKPFYKNPWFGLYWRFCPMYDDPQIERFIVRDTDSKLSEREAVAVQEWIASGKPFHIMRDNTAHNVPILGGMWGAVPGCVPNFAENIRKWMQTVQGHKENPMGRYHGTDQEFLWKFVWPVIKDNHIAHGIKYLGNELPFKVKNPDGYKVGTYT